MQSSPINIGSIQKLEIDISRDDGSKTLDTSGLRFDSQFEWNNFHERFPQLSKGMVPVGIPLLPGKEWIGMVTNRYSVSISADSAFVGPGKSVRSIVITSKGLPSIRACIVAPNFQDDLLFPNIEDTSSNAMTTAQMDSIREAVNYHGWTIGPTAPPLNFDASIWVDTVLSYIHRSHELGWINNERDDDAEQDERKEAGVVRNLEKRLTQVRDLIDSGKIDAAKKSLEMFLDKVEKLRKRQKREEDKNRKSPKIIFTSEAYALLKYNGEYLLDHLKEEDHGRHDKKEKQDEK